MHNALEFLLHHGYVVLLGWVFAEQIGLPVPSLPLLLAAGALAGTGHLNFFASLFTCVFAAVAADSIWYWMGRVKGIKGALASAILAHFFLAEIITPARWAGTLLICAGTVLVGLGTPAGDKL